MKTLNLTLTNVKRSPRKGAGANRRSARGLGAQQMLMGLAAFRAARVQKRATSRKGDNS
jgi:hypothetical protein